MKIYNIQNNINFQEVLTSIQINGHKKRNNKKEEKEKI